MASAYNNILVYISLFCCFCNLVSSDHSRDSFTSNLQGSSFGCRTLGNNASVSFQNNVNFLLSDFIQQSSTTNYYNTSIGGNPDTVYGYFMCRGDVSLEVCNSCIFNATEFARRTDICRQEYNGHFSTELCIFRYTNYSTYGMWNIDFSEIKIFEANVSNYMQFNQTLSSTLEDLINEAAFESRNNGSTLGFATKEGRVTQNQTIYSMAQCTPDIMGVNCSQCLQSGFSDLRSLANGTPAAYVLVNKCFLRYDNVSFYDLGDRM